MASRKEFETAKQNILEYLVAALQRKTQDFKDADTDKERRKIKFLMNFISSELRSIKDLRFEDLPDE